MLVQIKKAPVFSNRASRLKATLTLPEVDINLLP
jgi:hypothetical protein